MAAALRTTYKKPFVIIAINVLVFVGLLAGIEIMASLFVNKAGENLIPDAYLNHTWRPNFSWTHDEWVEMNPAFPLPYTHTYNAQSWLETYDIQPDKAPGSYRIFYLGDSFTEGTCPMEQSVPSRVEQKLNQLSRGTGDSVEVVNTGTSSYSPTLYFLLLRRKILAFHPDLVVINVDMTDFFDDWKYAETLTVDHEGVPVAAPPRNLFRSSYVDTAAGAVPLTTMRRLQLWLLQHSNTYALIRKIMYQVQAGSSGQATTNENETIMRRRWAWAEQQWSADTVADMDRSLRMLQSIVELCRKNNVKIMITSVPHYHQYADFNGKGVWSPRAHYEIARMAEKSGVPYLNSYEALRPFIQGTPQSRYYYNGDMHFNPDGYALWAQTHIDFLLNKKNNLLPEIYYQRK